MVCVILKLIQIIIS